MSHSVRPSAPPILIVLIAGIGDLVLASASIRAIRNGHPGSEIHVLTSTDAAPLAVNYPYIDHVHTFPIRELRNSKTYLLDVIRLIRHLRRTTFDKLVNLYWVSSLSGAAKMGLLFSSLKAETKIGEDRFGFGLVLKEKVPSGVFSGRHIAEAMQLMAARAGGITDGKGIEVFWNADIASRWKDFFASLEGTIIVGINPGGKENYRWPPERFAVVAETIITQFNARVILLGGPAEADIAAYIAGRISSDVLNLAGKTPVDALPYIMSRMNLLITNDSGPMHVAAAAKTPLVALFGPEDPRIFGPYTKPERYRVLRHEEPSCRPCQNKKCTPLPCMELITSEEVTGACLELLRDISMQGSTA